MSWNTFKEKSYHEWKYAEISDVELNLQRHDILIVSEYLKNSIINLFKEFKEKLEYMSKEWPKRT